MLSFLYNSLSLNSNSNSTSSSKKKKYSKKIVKKYFNYNNKQIKEVHINHTNIHAFSISMWINVNNNINQSGIIPLIIADKSHLLYHMYDNDLKENTFVFNLNRLNTVNDCTLVLPLQKWNHIVFTYDGNFLLFYCNNVLVKIIKEYTLDFINEIQVGSGIMFDCILYNSTYFYYTLSPSEINTMYYLYQ
jgi:hypothetical protein